MFKMTAIALQTGSIALVMAMIGSLLTALVIAREWERGTIEAVMATPMGPSLFMATKVIPYFLLGLGSMTICTLLAITVFGVPFRGSPFALLAIGSAFLVPALGQGLFISAATKSQFVASQFVWASSRWSVVGRRATRGNAGPQPDDDKL